MKSRKVAVRLSESQLEILRELMKALRTTSLSDAVRFCIELTGLILSARLDYYTIGVINALEEATRRVKKVSDASSDKDIKKPKFKALSGDRYG